jgi:hypothetical protein
LLALPWFDLIRSDAGDDLLRANGVGRRGVGLNPKTKETKKMKKFVGMLVCVGALVASTASATPIYVAGNVCPPGPAPGPGPARQYTASGAIACAYDPAAGNIQGDQAEADLYLNSAQGVLALGNGLSTWTGLGQNPTGFSFTSNAAGTSGSFLIGAPLTNVFNQFVLGIKDGGNPMFALFLLPQAQTAGTWAFLSNGGNLSHFALYGRLGPTPGQFCTDPNGCDTPAAVPEPGSLMLLGSGLVGLATTVRKRLQRQA